MVPSRLWDKFYSAGPPLVSLIGNTVIFVLLFLFGIPEFIPDPSDTIQVTVGTFFAPPPAPAQPSEGGGESENLSRLASSYNVASVASVQTPAQSAETIAVITSASRAASDLDFQQAAAPRIDQGQIARAAAVSRRNLAAAGSGQGNGSGMGTGAGGTVGRIGNLEIRTKRLAVIVDTSGSMFENKDVIQQARTQAGALCHDTHGKLVEQDGSAVNGKFVDTVLALAKRHPDAVYWLCDLEDGEIPEQRARLRDILRREKIRFYICTWKRHPTAELLAIINDSGGALDMQGLAADTKWATPAPMVTICLKSGRVTMGQLVKCGYANGSETITLRSADSSHDVAIAAGDAEAGSWANASAVVNEWLSSSCLCPADFKQ